MWRIYVQNLLIRIHNSPEIWAHQPSLDTKRWTVENRTQVMHGTNHSLINTFYRIALKILLNQYYHSSNMATWITHTQKSWIHKNPTWVCHKHSLWCNAALTHTVTNNGKFIPLQSWGSKFHRSSTWFRILSRLQRLFFTWIKSLPCLQCNTKIKSNKIHHRIWTWLESLEIEILQID